MHFFCFVLGIWSIPWLFLLLNLLLFLVVSILYCSHLYVNNCMFPIRNKYICKSRSDSRLVCSQIKSYRPGWIWIMYWMGYILHLLGKSCTNKILTWNCLCLNSSCRICFQVFKCVGFLPNLHCKLWGRVVLLYS